MRGEALKAAILEAARKRRTRQEIDGLLAPGETFVFYVHPFSAADLGKHGKRLFEGDESAMVDILIDKAESEDGERLFDDDARQWLPQAITAQMLAQIAKCVADGMQRVVEESAEDAKGNSGGIPSDVPSLKRPLSAAVSRAS